MLRLIISRILYLRKLKIRYHKKCGKLRKWTHCRKAGCAKRLPPAMRVEG